MKMDVNGNFDIRSSEESELVRKRLLKGKCALCGKEKTLTPGITVGKKCWANWMKEHYPNEYKEMMHQTKKGVKR
jgi:hypothetical protein